MYRAIAANKRNTVFIIIVFVLLIGGLGLVADYLYGGGMTIFIGTLIGATAYVLFQYFASSSQALSMAGARQIEKRDNPRLYRIVENLAITEGLPMPKVYIVNDPAPNAFATGRDPQRRGDDRPARAHGRPGADGRHGARARPREELRHPRLHDRVRARRRGRPARRHPRAHGVLRRQPQQRQPDATGALTTRDPEALASALQKLGDYARPMRKQNSTMAHLWISDPMKPGIVDRMFQTHPPIPDRVKRLMENSTRF
mgnify:CR=1 FL=1